MATDATLPLPPVGAAGDPTALPYRSNGFLQGLRAKLQTLDHLVIGAEADVFPGQPPFAYTIGLAPHHGYELAISNLEDWVAQAILDTLAERARAGRLRPADKAPVMGAVDGGHVLRLRPADPSWRFHWIKPVLQLQAQPPVWQVEWPDAHGAFRGEPGHTELQQQDFTIPVGASAD